MNVLTRTFDAGRLVVWDELLNAYLLVGALTLLLFELGRYAARGRLSWNLLGDTVTNYITQVLFVAILFATATVYLGTFFVVYESFSLWRVPITGWSILLCVVLADLAYYWEHRFVHRVGIGWATHTVHHSSPHFNVSVAYRFGPLDGVFPLVFHLPLAVLGFHPILILFAESIVQLYQTALHTEVVGRLPRPVELVMNTPSHHRVHHGSNPEYLDRNYGGIFIVWDRVFGTFAEERAPVRYGIVEPLDSVNPLTVFLHGLTRLLARLRQAPNLTTMVGYLVRPPGWAPSPGERLRPQGGLPATALRE